ncbi:MAG: LptF/LptG family permease [Gemmatimonadaceae bacterium]
MKITSKYILREHVGPLVFALSALTSLLLLNYVAKKFGDLVGKGLHWSVIAEFFALSIPFTVAMTLPMAILVATLHAFGRFAAENEITAFKASGVSMHRLVAPVLVAGACFTVFMIWFNDQVLPRANHQLATLTTDISRKKPTVAFKEQIINEVSPNRLYLRAGHIDRASSMMKEVTIYDLSLPQKRRVIHSDSGLLEMSPDQVDLLLTLYSGTMTEVSLQKPAELQRNFFHTDFVKVKGVGNQFESASPDSTYKSDREMTICELQDQVVRAAKTRDSAWKVLYRYERKTALAMQPNKLRPGLGAAYCGLLSALKIKTAAAATVQDTTMRAKTAAAATAQDTAKQAPAIAVPPAPTPAPSPAPANAPPANAPPAYAPSTGRVVAPDSMSPSIRAVLAEGTKIQFANAEDIVDGHSVEIEKKFAIAVACFIFVLLGAPVALRFPRGGVGMTIGVSLAVFGLYYVGLIVGETLADRDYLSPFWGMWSANVILGTIGLWLTVRLGSEGATNRGSETSEMLDRLRQRARHLVRRRR